MARSTATPSNPRISLRREIRALENTKDQHVVAKERALAGLSEVNAKLRILRQRNSKK